MNFAIQATKRALLTELSRALPIVSHATQVSPVETHILLDATTGGGEVYLQATNFDVTLAAKLSAKIATPGAVAVPTRKLYEYVRQLPDGIINITATTQKFITVKAGSSATRFAGIDPAGFPARSEALPTIVRMDADILRGMLARARIAVSNQNTRFHISCLQCRVAPTSIRFAGTDGNQLAITESSEGGVCSAESTVELLIPLTAVGSLGGFLAECDKDDAVQIGFSDVQICFTATERRLSVPRVQGSYPYYNAVLEADEGQFLIVGRRPVLDAIERISQFADAKHNSVAVKASNGLLQVSAGTLEFGEAKETIAAEYTGEEFSARFNATYLCRFLRVIEISPKVRFAFNPATRAAQIRPHERMDPFGYRYVLAAMVA